MDGYVFIYKAWCPEAGGLSDPTLVVEVPHLQLSL